MIQINIILYIILFIFSSCIIPGEDHPTIRESLPDNFKIHYMRHSGMLPDYENMILTRDSCVIYYVTDKRVDTVKFNLPEKKLKNLYDLFIENEFSKIETMIEEVYDRGGVTISLSWKNGRSKKIEKSNSGRSFVTDKWIGRWNNIVSELEKLVTEYEKK